MMDPISATTLAIGGATAQAQAAGTAALAAYISAATAATTSAISYSQARAQNEALSRQAESTARAAEVQTQQLQEAAGVERKQRLDEAHLIRQRLRVASAESGLSIGPLDRLATYDAAQNLRLLDRNLASQVAAVRTSSQASLDDLASRRLSPGLAAFSGGLTGAQAGLSIGGGLQQLTRKY